MVRIGEACHIAPGGHYRLGGGHVRARQRHEKLDVGWLVRGAEAVRLWGIAVDHGTRCIAPNDCLDTADETWEKDLLEACAEHVGHNAHTSKRLKKKLMNRFKKEGAITPCPTFGYIKPLDAKTFDDWRKDDAATPIIQEGARRLKETLNCSATADWFNQQGVPVGPYCDRKEWYGAMLRRYYDNTILKGMPCRGKRHTVKHHEKGKRVSVPNPKGPHYRNCPHLAHLDPFVFDELNLLLEAKNDKFRRKRVNGVDPLWNVSRKRTVFPGQHACCWYCGWHYVWGGNGVTENLMCSASRDWHCWNSIGFNGYLSLERIVPIIMTELCRLDGISDQFTDLVQRAKYDRSGRKADDWQRVLCDEAELEKEKANILAAIKKYGDDPMFDGQIKEFKHRGQQLAIRRGRLENARSKELHISEDISELRQLLEDNFQQLATESPEFGDLMRQLVPEFYVYLVRLVDGGHPLPRAKIKLNLAGSVQDAELVPGLVELLTRDVTIDLFDRPPQRERIRVEAVRLDAEGVPQRQIAARLPDEKPRLPAIQKALALDRSMKEQGLETPYVLLTEPPEDYPKLRRHKNPKYHFQPREGYVRPVI